MAMGAYAGLPGGDLVEQGLMDLSRGEETVASPNLLLYERLRPQEPDAGHCRYNAVVGRLVSFERALG